MEKIAHIWNVNQFMTQLNCPQTKNLQMFYLESCKKITKGCGLPRQQFGPNAMCVHCNSLWTTVDHKIRISRGRTIPKSIRKIVRSMEDKDNKVPKVRSTLGRKALKNETNKLLITCSICSRITKIPLSKPKRQKVNKVPELEPIITSKRKKKKGKDKTAGLNIPGSVKPNVEDTQVRLENKVKPMAPACNTVKVGQKLKKLNINRLKYAVTKGVTPKSKTLHSFLSGL